MLKGSENELQNTLATDMELWCKAIGGFTLGLSSYKDKACESLWVNLYRVSNQEIKTRLLFIFQDTPFTVLFFFVLFQGRVNIASKALDIDLVSAIHVSDHEKITSLTIKILVSIIGADDIHFKILCKFYAKNIGDFSTGCLKVNFCN